MKKSGTKPSSDQNMGQKTEKKRHYDSEESKRRLMEAALDTFSKEGYDAATTRTIAKKAGLNESLIQRYFKNKLGLFSTVLFECKKKLSASLPYSETDSVEEELKQFFEFRLAFFKKEKKILRLLLTRALLDAKTSDRMREVSHQGVPNLIDRLELLRIKGKLRPDLNLRVASVLIGGFAFTTALWTHILKSMDEKFDAELIELAIQVLARGISTSKNDELDVKRDPSI